MPLSVYLHIPFCRSRCSYCDFNTYAGLDSLIPDYVDALAGEVRMVGAAMAGHPRQEDEGMGTSSLEVHTVYFGGGTPSLLPPESVGHILDTLRAALVVRHDCEITLEANPGTVDLNYLRGLREAGVNRLSLGVQSSQAKELRLLGRSHSFAAAINAVEYARRAGFENLNLDMILGLPGQSVDDASLSLKGVLDLDPHHLSVYTLALEEGTPLAETVRHGLLPPPDPDQAADMMEGARDVLAARGYVHYEISNWAKAVGTGQNPGNAVEPPFACRHNLQYWRNRPYLGFGAGAHGYAEGQRYSNVLSPGEYVERMRQPAANEFPYSPAVREVSRIDQKTEMGETMIMGLRLIREGVPRAAFRDRFGVDLESAYGPQLDELEVSGLVERHLERIRLTQKGWLLGNQVFQAFV